MNGVLLTYAHWAVIGSALTGATLVIVNDRRGLAITLGIQYFFAGWLAAGTLGTNVAGAQVLGGLVAAIIIWLTWKAAGRRPRQPRPTNDLMDIRPFRWVVVLLVAIAAWGLGRRSWMGLPGLTFDATMGSTFLMLLGLLQASLFRRPMRVVLGLLTMLSGFGIAYSAVETSLAVIALLILVNLGLALAGSYLTIVEVPEPRAPAP